MYKAKFNKKDGRNFKEIPQSRIDAVIADGTKGDTGQSGQISSTQV